MKAIEMKIEEFSLKRRKAYELWKEYSAALKRNPKDEFLKDMKAVYTQLKSGRKVVDITNVIQKAGLKEDYSPRLAIAPANARICFCLYRHDGLMKFSGKMFDRYNTSVEDVAIRNTMPKIPDKEFLNVTWEGDKEKRWTAPVPVIPASIRPSKYSKQWTNYYVLWEVENWKPEPPKDPYLLRRLTRNMFVVVAGWNLTELERAVMKGRL
jgi:hypothetical protein